MSSRLRGGPRRPRGARSRRGRRRGAIEILNAAAHRTPRSDAPPLARRVALRLGRAEPAVVPPTAATALLEALRVDGFDASGAAPARRAQASSSTAHEIGPAVSDATSARIARTSGPAGRAAVALGAETEREETRWKSTSPSWAVAPGATPPRSAQRSSARRSPASRRSPSSAARACASAASRPRRGCRPRTSSTRRATRSRSSASGSASRSSTSRAANEWKAPSSTR